MKLVKISEAEKEVMQIIWASGNPMTSVEILELLPPERAVKITRTLLTFLTRLTGCMCVEKRKKIVCFLSSLKRSTKNSNRNLSLYNTRRLNKELYCRS